VVGLRKPDPRIYELSCREVGVAPARAAFLDDIGGDRKPARVLGMTAIKSPMSIDPPRSATRPFSSAPRDDQGVHN